MTCPPPATMGSPFHTLVVGDKVSRSLAKRGLLEPVGDPETKDAGFFTITPAGLRVLADALECGKVEQFFDPRFRRDRVRLYYNTEASVVSEHKEADE